MRAFGPKQIRAASLALALALALSLALPAAARAQQGEPALVGAARQAVAGLDRASDVDVAAGPLGKALKSSDPAQRTLALQLVVEVLREATSDASDASAQRQLRYLRRATAAVSGALDDPDTGVREAALEALGQLLADDKQPAPAVIRALAQRIRLEAVPELRLAVLDLLLATADASTLKDALRAAAADRDPRVSDRAKEVLAQR